MSECILANGKNRPKMRVHGKSINKSRYLILDKLKEGEQANHTCGNSNCINPEHLYVGTQKENNADRIRDGHYPNHCINGHEYTQANTRYVHTKSGKLHRLCRECRKKIRRNARRRFK